MSRLKALQIVLKLAQTRNVFSKQELEAMKIIKEFVINLQNTRGVETGEF